MYMISLCYQIGQKYQIKRSPWSRPI